MVSSLSGRKIAVTRPEPGTLAGRLAALGADVGHVPLIAIGPPGDRGAALHAALDDLDSFDWLVVTSANGAAAVGNAAGRYRQIQLAAVGAATARRLAALAGRRIDLVPSTASADGLLAELPAGRTRVLLAQGNLATDHLAAGLRSKGHEVVVVEAYTTSLRSPSPVEVGLLAAADAVLLASGSAARALEDAGLAELPAAVVAIGPKTADVARGIGLTVAAVAESPSDDAVVAALLTALP